MWPQTKRAQGISTPEDCLPEFPSDASMQAFSSYDVIPMADASVVAQAGADTVEDCQAGCGGRGEYYAFYDYK